MKRQASEIYLERRLLPLLRHLLAEVRCSRCSRSGDDHFEADHLLEDPEDENRPSGSDSGLD
jgi:hypothetical protein